MSTTAQEGHEGVVQGPAEKLAEAVEGLSNVAGLDEATVAKLREQLNPSRVRKVQGNDYLAAHDVIRTANRIFGFGKWGYDVIDLEPIGRVERARDGKQGWHVGYRCTVRLTVAGCVPVCGVGFGDGVEYTPGAVVSAQELAMKEAESDALKRAFRNFGDQFGLILYAKDDEKRRIAAEEAAECGGQPTLNGHRGDGSVNDQPQPIAEGDRAATADEVAALLDTAEKAKGADGRKKAEEGVAGQRRLHGGDVSSKWIGKCMKALLDQAPREPNVDQSDFQAPPGAATSGGSEPQTITGDDVAAAVGQ